MRCSILFHLLVPGGKWQTETAIPVSSVRLSSAPQTPPYRDRFLRSPSLHYWSDRRLHTESSCPFSYPGNHAPVLSPACLWAAIHDRRSYNRPPILSSWRRQQQPDPPFVETPWSVH